MDMVYLVKNVPVIKKNINFFLLLSYVSFVASNFFRYLPLVLGDENVILSKHGDLEKDFEAWSQLLEDKLKLNLQTGVHSQSVSQF